MSEHGPRHSGGALEIDKEAERHVVEDAEAILAGAREAMPPRRHESHRPVGRVALLESLNPETAVPSVDWPAMHKLSSERGHIVASKLAERAAFVPAIASLVARRKDSAVEHIAPTADSIKEQKPFMGFVSDVIRFFSDDWANRFDGWLVRKASDRLEHYSETIDTLITKFGRIERPKKQFLDEIETLYTHLATSRSRGRLRRTALTVLTRGDPYNPNSRRDKWYKESDYPLLSGVAGDIARQQPHTPSILMSRTALRTVTPEVIEGLKQFLEEHDRHPDTGPVSHRRASFARRAALRFGGTRRRIEAVPAKVKETLGNVYAALPERGRDFEEDVRQLCAEIVRLSNAGHSGQQITRALTRDFQQKHDHFKKKP